MEQMNYMFDRRSAVCRLAVGPMRSVDDRMEDTPAYQQDGVECCFAKCGNRPSWCPILCFARAPKQ